MWCALWPERQLSAAILTQESMGHLEVPLPNLHPHYGRPTPVAKSHLIPCPVVHHSHHPRSTRCWAIQRHLQVSTAQNILLSVAKPPELSAGASTGGILLYLPPH